MLPNSYEAALLTYGDPADPANNPYWNDGDTQNSHIASYTCFYYEYNDALNDGRVTKEVLFGKSDEYTFSYTSGYPFSPGQELYYVNDWAMETTENLPDGSTSVVYTNYLGQVLLSDLQATVSGVPTHTITFNQYTCNVYNDSDPTNGQLLFTAEPSVFDPNSPDYVAHNNYSAGDYTLVVSPLSDTGLVDVYRYYTNDSQNIDSNSGQGWYSPTQPNGYLESEWVRAGLTSPVGYGGVFYYYPAPAAGATKLHSYTYDTTITTANGSSIYPLTKEMDYPTGTAVETDYTNTPYPGTLNLNEVETQLPAVTTDQNGRSPIGGTPIQDTSFAWCDTNGNLVWQQNALGTFTYNCYDPLTGLLDYTIQDIDQTTANSLSLSVPSGWYLPGDPGLNNPRTSGIDARTDYQYDGLGRVTEVLGPVHDAVVWDTNQYIRERHPFGDVDLLRRLHPADLDRPGIRPRHDNV